VTPAYISRFSTFLASQYLREAQTHLPQSFKEGKRGGVHIAGVFEAVVVVVIFKRMLVNELRGGNVG
jgi:hypothetical protein